MWSRALLAMVFILLTGSPSHACNFLRATHSSSFSSPDVGEWGGPSTLSVPIYKGKPLVPLRNGVGYENGRVILSWKTRPRPIDWAKSLLGNRSQQTDEAQFRNEQQALLERHFSNPAEVRIIDAKYRDSKYGGFFFTISKDAVVLWDIHSRGPVAVIVMNDPMFFPRWAVLSGNGIAVYAGNHWMRDYASGEGQWSSNHVAEYRGDVRRTPELENEMMASFQLVTPLEMEVTRKAVNDGKVFWELQTNDELAYHSNIRLSFPLNYKESSKIELSVQGRFGPEVKLDSDQVELKIFEMGFVLAYSDPNDPRSRIVVMWDRDDNKGVSSSVPQQGVLQPTGSGY